MESLRFLSFAQARIGYSRSCRVTRLAIVAFVSLPMAMFFGPFPTDFCIAIIGLAFLYHSFSHQNWSWLSDTWLKWFLCFWAWMVMRALWSIDPVDSLTHALLLGRYGLLSAAIARWLLLQDEVKWLFIYGVIAAVTFAIVDGGVQFLFGYDLFGKPLFHSARLTGPLNRPRLGLTMAWLGVPLIALGLAYLHSQEKKSLKQSWFWALLGFGVLFIGVASGDRGGLLEMLFGISVLGVLTPAYRSLLLKAVCLFPLLLVMIFAYSPDTFHRQVTSTINKLQHFSSSDYGVVYRGGWSTFIDYPVFGVGARQYRDVCPMHHQDLRMATKEGGDQFKLMDQEHLCGHHPHNFYLEVLAESGLLGASLLIGLFVGAIRACWKNRHSIKHDAFFLGCLAVLLSRLFPAFPSGSLYVVWGSVPLWLMLGIVLGVNGRLVPTRESC